MKTLLTFVLGSFLALSGVAQTTGTVNITFRGINSGTNNYQVMIDGTSYFSNTNSEKVPNYKITVKNLAVGTHALKVYRLKNNNPAYNNRAQTFVYSKNFELRQDYDMNITVLKTGQVQFGEVSAPLDQSVVKSPMTSYQFNQLALSVQNKNSQALRSQAVRDAFTNTANYFTTTQVRQLLSYVTSESDRLYLVKLSFAAVTDPANFSQLANMFNSTAYRNEFNYYVSTNVGLNNSTKTQMTTSVFNQLLQNVKDKWSQALKAEAVRDAFVNTNNYFSTAQIRQLLVLINSESDRLTLAKLSYRGVTDAANFIQLSDLFNSTAYRNEFNTYASTNGGVTNPVNTQMTTYAYNQLLQSVKDKWSQALKAEAVRDAFVNTNNYFSTAQIKQLVALVNSESDRFDLVKLSFRGVTDQDNFVQLADLFSSTTYRNEFNNYVSVNVNGGVGNSTKTQMTTYAFNQLLQNVKDKWSQALKAEAERDAFINTNNYFSTEQIRQLLVLITSEGDRLDLAKLSYRSVTDPAYFTQLSELFTIAANKTEFNNFVRANGGVTVETAKIAMSDGDFSVLVLSVRANLLQVLKVSAERDIFSNPNNYFTSTQVKQLISLINSETNRLELAKLSYRSVTDRDNFTQLYDLFKVQSNKDALAAYVKANQTASL